MAHMTNALVLFSSISELYASTLSTTESISRPKRS